MYIYLFIFLTYDFTTSMNKYRAFDCATFFCKGSFYSLLWSVALKSVDEFSFHFKNVKSRTLYSYTQVQSAYRSAADAY